MNEEIPDSGSRTPTSRRRFKLVLWVGSLMLVSGVMGFAGLYFYIVPRLPSIESLKDVRFQEPLRVYTADGKLIAEYGEKKRIPLAINEIPEILQNAFIAAEDDRFWKHPGIDYQGLLRAVFNLLITGSKSQGGSTITMQVARNFFLSSEKTYIRKLNEIFLALRIEKELTKAQILELYLNKIYLGQRAYGVGAAAQVYYGRSINELTLAESAMIAGLPKAPSKFNPLVNPARAVERRSYVLGRMLELAMIDETQYTQALNSPLSAQPYETVVEVEAPYVGEMVRAFAVERYGEEEAYSVGLKVYTTINSRLQKVANVALRNGLLDYEKRHGYRGRVGSIEDTAGFMRLRASLGRSPAHNGATKDQPAKELVQQQVAAESEGLFIDTETDELQQRLDQRLSEVGSISNLHAAVIIGIEDQAAHAYIGQGKIVRIDWEGLSWAAPFIDANNKGENPKVAANVVRVGDIVWLRPNVNDDYSLSQAPEVEGAFVALNPDNAAILALVGGYDFFRSKFNRVVQAERQPGSNFKPFIYAAALENGFTAASIFNDAPVVFDDPTLEDQWRPENYSKKFYGPTRLREGLVKSRNLVSVRLLIALGIAKARRYAKRLGFPDSALPYDLSLVLGSGTLTPLQLASGFAVFANGGYEVKPFLIDSVLDSRGEPIFFADYQYVCEACFENEAPSSGYESAGAEEPTGYGADTALLSPAEVRATVVESDQLGAENALLIPNTNETQTPQLSRVLKPAPRIIEARSAYIMNSMLQDVTRRGTGVRVRELGRSDLAGKTGTTNDFIDAWFSGYQRRIVATSWVGFDTRKSLGNGEAGARAALPIWLDFMREALADVSEETLVQPEGLTTIRIDAETGLLANSSTPNTLFEIFKHETVPTEEAHTPVTAYGKQQTSETTVEEDIF